MISSAAIIEGNDLCIIRKQTDSNRKVDHDEEHSNELRRKARRDENQRPSIEVDSAVVALP